MVGLKVAVLITCIVCTISMGASSSSGESLFVIINEFGQGKAYNAEWIELLVVGTGPCSTVDLRGFFLYDREGYKGLGSPTRVKFRAVSEWEAVPAGTIIVVYNGAEQKTNFPEHFPPDDLDFSDHRVVLPSTHTYFFSDVAWGGFRNDGDWIVLVDATGAVVDGLSYGDRVNEDGAREVKLGGVGAKKAARYTGTTGAGVNFLSNWETGSDVSGFSTPGHPNPNQEAWLAELRPPAISLSPTSHDFGEVLVGSESLPLTVTVRNTGYGTLVLGTITLGGANPDEFRIQNDNCSGQTIPPNGSGDLQVVFAPTTGGSKSATLLIPSQDCTISMAEVSLSGVGQVSSLSAEAGGPYSGVVGLTITLTGSAAGGVPPYYFAWDLDGDRDHDDAFGPIVTWIWHIPGIYTVGLMVRDLLGAVATDTAEVWVRAARGDVNGDSLVDLVDVRLAFQAVRGFITLTPEEQARADMDDDGDVDLDDVQLLCCLVLGGCS